MYRRRLAAEPDRLSTADRAPARSATTSPRTTLADLLVETGLAERRDGSLRGLVRVVPHDELLIASDRLDVEDADRVAGVHRPSATLAHLTVREPVERALDLCTGNGIQALLLSRHARHVVATDVNARALAFAAFNLALNGVANVELREGSLLEPVRGERFGCIACNPPYVVSPDAVFTFRDSGLPGDRVSELLARGLPGLLEPGGFATLMASWAQTGDAPGVRPREWLDGSGCDSWILHTTTDDPLSNAAAWTREAVDGPEEFGATLDRWTAYYRELGIEALAYGALVLRRRDGDNWSRGASLPPRALERRRGTCCACSPVSISRSPAPTSLLAASGSPSRRPRASSRSSRRARAGRWSSAALRSRRGSASAPTSTSRRCGCCGADGTRAPPATPSSPRSARTRRCRRCAPQDRVRMRTRR